MNDSLSPEAQGILNCFKSRNFRAGDMISQWEFGDSIVFEKGFVRDESVRDALKLLFEEDYLGEQAATFQLLKRGEEYLYPCPIWTCDKCNQPIFGPENGWLEWDYDQHGANYQNFKIVHYFPEKCFTMEKPGQSLELFVGPDGMARLLAFIKNDGPDVADRNEFIRTFYRLHIPPYEGVRTNLDQSHEWLQQEMAAAFEELKDTDELE